MAEYRLLGPVEVWADGEQLPAEVQRQHGGHSMAAGFRLARTIATTTEWVVIEAVPVTSGEPYSPKTPGH